MQSWHGYLNYPELPRLKLAIVGNGPPLRDHPLRVAEEVAMLDVVTGERIISGFVRGIGCEYFSLDVNPTHSMERFREAHHRIEEYVAVGVTRLIFSVSLLVDRQSLYRFAREILPAFR